MSSEVITDPGTAEPSGVPIKDAATVILVRDGADGLEVFLQRRVKGMAFAGGMTVFPGGRADSSDSSRDIGWSGPSPQWRGQRWRTDPERARTLVLAAVRETFEECGVLLAGTGAHALASTAADSIANRALLERHEPVRTGSCQPV